MRDVVHACGTSLARVCGKGLGGVREASGERLAGCAGRRAGGVRERRRVQHGLLRPDRVQVGQEGAALRAQVLVGEHRRLWSTGRARGEEEPRRRACLHRSHPVEQRVRRRALERARSVALEERRVPAGRGAGRRPGSAWPVEQGARHCSSPTRRSETPLEVPPACSTASSTVDCSLPSAKTARALERPRQKAISFACSLALSGATVSPACRQPQKTSKKAGTLCII